MKRHPCESSGWCNIEYITMAIGSAWLGYRPVRFGLCVRRGNYQDLRRVLRLTHTLWGGRYNPIIPVPDENVGQALIEQYRVDALYPAVMEEAQLKEFIQQFPYLPWPGFHKEFFTPYAGGQSVSTFLDIYHPVRKMFEMYIKDKPNPQLNVKVFEWSATDSLTDVLLALFGAYPPADEIGRDYSELVLKNLKGARVNLAPTDVVPADAYEKVMPSAITDYGLQPDRFPGWDYHGIYVGNSGDFDDIVNF
jgi:hypothetical protein